MLTQRLCPVCSEIVGRKTFRKKGRRKRIKIRTAGREKERWTYTPILWADGRKRKFRGVSTFHGAVPPHKGATTNAGRKKKAGTNTIAKELENWKSNGFPAGYAYTCNMTAYFKQYEAEVALSGIRRSLRDDCTALELPPSLLIVDDYSVHKTESFVEGVRKLNMEQETVVGGMSCLCNPGDVIINKIQQAKSKNKYVAWVMQQPLREDGTPPLPTRAQACA